MKRKILSLALALALCLGLTVPALAAGDMQTIYLNGYDTTNGLTGVKEGSLMETQMELTVKGTLKQVDTGILHDFGDIGDFTYPVYEVPASGVNVIVWNFDWNDKIGMWIESATISAVSYDTAAKSYTVLQENAVQWHESPLETENGEPTLEGSWVQLTQPGTYLIDIRYAVVAGGCIAVVTIPEAETAGGETPAAAGFTDVKPGDWFAEPVKWAVERKITEGTGNGQFSPSKTCTKGQIITFIWRANGSPEPDAAKISAFSGNPFPDLTGEEYYYTAALWAYTQGMTAGGLAFDGAEPCTRASAVYYIWAAAGEPAPGGKAGFTDLIPALHSVDAIAWAVERGVTEGTGNNTFSPDKPCTRGQIVTFLYRALG